jgi:hypothetical protein
LNCLLAVNGIQNASRSGFDTAGVRRAFMAYSSAEGGDRPNDKENQH